MKHLKLYEYYSEFYIQIGEYECESLISNENLYCFSDIEMNTINKCRKCNVYDGHLYNYGNSFYIKRGGDLDDINYENTNINKITIHETDGSKTVVNLDDICEPSCHRDIDRGKGDHRELENYTMVHVSEDNYLIAINKLSDEWYAIVEMSPEADWKFYKCDQLDGVINFLSKH